MINEIPEIIVSMTLIIISAIIGSFLNVVIHRVPTDDSVVSPRSHCPTCKNNLRIIDNIPIVSYLILQAKCFFCKERIPARYIFVECLSVILTLLLYNVYGPSSSFILFTALTYLLIAVTFIDIDYFIIPNEFIIIGLLVLIPSLFFEWLPLKWDDGLNGSLCFSGFLFSMGIIGQFILKKESIGFGDVKLGLILGGFLGLELSILALYLSFVSSALIVLAILFKGNAERGMKIPFGPYLAIGTLVALLTNIPSGGNIIINWYFESMF